MTLNSENFQNVPSKRFYDFFNKKIESGELSNKTIAEKFEKYQSNPGVLFRGLYTGRNSVTVELIILAQKHFSLDPSSLFDTEIDWKNIEPVSVKKFYATDSVPLMQHIGRLVNDIFKRHKTNIKHYAETRLHTSEQNLHKQMRGEGRMFADTMIIICEDHAEPLEQFRRTPLPQGHLLERLKIFEQMMELKDQRIKQLEQQLSEKL